MLTEVFSHIHPILVHFPIALIVVGFSFDLIRLLRKQPFSPKAGLWLWIIAVIGAILAFMTGPDHDARGNTNLIDTHSTLAGYVLLTVTIVVAIRLFVWLARSQNQMTGVFLTVYILFSFLSVVLVLATGYYGGKMVYDEGIGVQVNGQFVNPPQSESHR